MKLDSARDGKGARVVVARLADVAGSDLLPAIG
jgi:hypothetical protein